MIQLFRTSLFVIFSICISSSVVWAQNDWVLKKEKDGIQVYFRNFEGSKIRELKIELEVHHSFNGVIDALNDVEACPDWVYACGLVDILEQKSNAEMLYYTVIDFPWPLQDRDAYITTNNEYTSTTFTSTSHGIVDYKPATNKLVRLPEIDIEWYVEKRANGIVFIRYTLHSDPGGIIPAWAINLALDKGPIQSMKSFQKFLKKNY